MTRGTKDDLQIYRMVAQSKGNCLPASDIVKKGKKRSLYLTLERLCGGFGLTDDIPGVRLFCFHDLVEGITNEQLEKLKAKLNESYRLALPSEWKWNWKKVKIRLEKRTADKTVLGVYHENDKNNNITIKLYPNKKNDAEKAKMTIRRKFALTDDISKCPPEIWALAEVSRLESSIPEKSILRKCIKANYVSLPIPLIPERNDKRLYFRTLSRESYYRDRHTTACLRFTLNEEGERLVQLCEKKIYNLTYNNSSLNTLLSKKNKQEKEKLQHEIFKIKSSIRYNNVSMTINGLLQYAIEEEYKPFKKSIRNLADCDEYDEIVREGYERDDLGFPELQIQIPATNYHFRYKIKGNFPFLSYYDVLEKSLPEQFVFILLKRIATIAKRYIPTRVKRYFLDTMPQGLRYIVTKMFYDRIKRWWISKRTAFDNNNNNSTIDNDKETEKTGVADYLSEIGEYIGHIEERESVERKNAKIYRIIKQRCHKFYKVICTTIENYKDKEGVIPIYEQIKKARLPWNRISEILELIEEKYRNGFIVTDTCLIAKSKAKMLKSLLNEEPLRDEACLSLIKSGVPKSCIVLDLENFLNKLGFGTRSEDSKVELEPNLKHDIFRVVKLKKRFRLKYPLIFQ